MIGCVQYTIAVENNSMPLEVMINAYIRNGWMPQGGICVVNMGDGVKCYQAMVRTVEKPVDGSSGKA